MCAGVLQGVCWGSPGVLGFFSGCDGGVLGFPRRCARVLQGVCWGSPESLLTVGVLQEVSWGFPRSLQGFSRGCVAWSSQWGVLRFPRGYVGHFKEVCKGSTRVFGSPRGMLGFPTGGMGCTDLAIEGE